MPGSSRVATTAVVLIGLVLASACGPSSSTTTPPSAPVVGAGPTTGRGGAAPAPAATPTRPAAPTSGAAGATTAPVATAVGAAPAATSAPAAQARNVSGTLVVYSALNESTNNAFIDAFKKAYPGITGVDVLPLAAAGELQTRIQTEKNAPKGDIFIGGSSEFHDPLGKEGLLEQYNSPNAKDIDAKFKDANGYWVGWYTGIFGFISNNDRLSKEIGNKKPSTWDD